MGDIILNGVKYSSGNGDLVSWNQITTTGTKIAEITINSTTQNVYAPSGGGGSEVYSYTEQLIGVWTDGKPLYRITVPFDTGVVASNINFNINAYMPADCIVQKSFHTIEFTYSGENYHGANWGGSYLNMNGNHYFSFNIGSATYDKHVELTIEYTKTTD